MVRARVREHLEALKRRFPAELRSCAILASADTDYAVRIIVDKAVWTSLVSRLADDVDYTNFKAEVERYQRADEDPYVQALHEVWSVMRGLQS